MVIFFLLFFMDIGVHDDRNQNEIEKVVTNSFYWLPKQETNGNVIENETGILMKCSFFCKKTSIGLTVLFGIGPSRRKLFSFGFETKSA